MYLQHRKPADGMLIGSSSRNPVGDAPTSPKYSDKLSPAINNYLSEASRQEVRVSNIIVISSVAHKSEKFVCLLLEVLDFVDTENRMY